VDLIWIGYSFQASFGHMLKHSLQMCLIIPMLKIELQIQQDQWF
jgi:hypothetical protein